MTQILYGLECQHAAPGKVNPFPPLLVCAWCQVPKQVTAIVVWEWAANCRNCTFKRFANLSRDNAGIMAAGHIRKPGNGSHSVVVEYVVNPAASEAAERFLRKIVEEVRQ